MKKALISLAGILTASIFFGSFASADLFINDVFDSNGVALSDAYTRILSEYDSSRGYSSSEATLCNAANGEVTITSPIITDAELYDATTYRLFLSPYRVSQLKDGNNVDLSKIIMKEYRKAGDSTEVSFNVSTVDGIDNNKTYYAFLLPISEYDELGTPSEEFCFQLGKDMCVWGGACDTIDAVTSTTEVNNTEEHGSATEDQHGAGCIGMDLANVTHTVSNGVITLKWTSLGDGSTVQIAIFDPEEEIYKSLGSAKMDDEKFEYKMQWNGEQNFSLTNGCKEVYYKADAKITTPTEPEKVVTPATGPAENILVIAIVAIVLYGVYAIFFRKSENN